MSGTQTEHVWKQAEFSLGGALTFCACCGIVRRPEWRVKRDGPQKPCPGNVRVTLRDTPETHLNAANLENSQ